MCVFVFSSMTVLGVHFRTAVWSLFHLLIFCKKKKNIYIYNWSHAMVSLCECLWVFDRGRKRFYEIKWPPLSNSMSNSESLSFISVINVRRQPFGCSLSKIEKLFTLPKIGIVESNWTVCSDRKAGWRKGKDALSDKGCANIWSLDLVWSVWIILPLCCVENLADLSHLAYLSN